MTTEAPRSGDASPRAVHPTLWTLILGATLVGVALLPRGARPARKDAENGEKGQGSGLGLDSEGTPASYSGAQAEKVASSEPERGRQADKPSEIPLAGWKSIGMRVFHEFGNDRVLLVSAGVTFYAILAIFPAIAALVSIYGIFADAGSINDQLGALQSVMPSGALEIIGDQVKRIAAKGGGTLGLSALVGIVLSIWSANGGMKAIFDALNIVYAEQEKRNFIWLNIRSLTFTAGALVILLAALGGIVVVPVALKFLGLSDQAWLLAGLRWPALLVVILGGLAVLYRYGPSRNPAKWRWITWGSGMAALLWVGVSLLFSWYVASFGSYNETYGSLGAAIGFMTWIWISTTIVLVGAEVNAEMEHQTAKDTTEGAAKPLGARSAIMADTVGA